MPIQDIRLIHFLLMFWFLAFAVHHLYSAFLIDVEERNGELSSMITGWKLDEGEERDF
jgi:Ni/Fe-hydrogenase 1 B-type cytochrome subunit